MIAEAQNLEDCSFETARWKTPRIRAENEVSTPPFQIASSATNAHSHFLDLGPIDRLENMHFQRDLGRILCAEFRETRKSVATTTEDAHDHNGDLVGAHHSFLEVDRYSLAMIGALLVIAILDEVQ